MGCRSLAGAIDIVTDRRLWIIYSGSSTVLRSGARAVCICFISWVWMCLLLLGGFSVRLTSAILWEVRGCCRFRVAQLSDYLPRLRFCLVAKSTYNLGQCAHRARSESTDQNVAALSCSLLSCLVACLAWCVCACTRSMSCTLPSWSPHMFYQYTCLFHCSLTYSQMGGFRGFCFIGIPLAHG